VLGWNLCFLNGHPLLYTQQHKHTHAKPKQEECVTYKQGLHNIGQAQPGHYNITRLAPSSQRDELATFASYTLPLALVRRCRRARVFARQLRLNFRDSGVLHRHYTRAFEAQSERAQTHRFRIVGDTQHKNLCDFIFLWLELTRSFWYFDIFWHQSITHTHTHTPVHHSLEYCVSIQVLCSYQK